MVLPAAYAQKMSIAAAVTRVNVPTMIGVKTENVLWRKKFYIAMSVMIQTAEKDF